MGKYKKQIIIGIGIILAVFFILYIRGCKQNLNLIYDYEKVDRGDVVKTVSTNGNIELLEPLVILSKISGVVQAVYVDYNAKVYKGQLLALIDPGNLQDDIYKLKKQLEKARIDLMILKKDLDTKENLYRDKLISKNALELARLNYKKSLATVKQIEIDYKSLVEKNRFRKVRSLTNGYIINKYIDVGDPVSPNKRLFLIASTLDKMKLIINVDESDIGKIKKNQKVTFTVSAFPEKKFFGKIKQIRFFPIEKSNIVSYQAVVICNNKDRLLKPGMTATAVIEIAKKKNVLRVPNEALIISNLPVEIPENKSVVWVKKISVSGIPVKPVNVKLGLEGDRYTEIVGGKLKAGDTILVRVRKTVDVKDEISSYGQ